MKTPGITGGVLGLVAIAAVFWVLSQQRDLAGLRAEQKRVLAQLSAEPGENSRPADQPADNVAETGSSPELLQLRSEITRLTQRKRELAGVEKEHEKLRASLAAHVSQPGGRLLLSSTARMAGYNTPEDTMESLLWALQHGDFTNFLQAFSPEVAQVFPIQTQEAWTNAMNDFHEQFTGLSILGRRELPDGRVELTVKLAGHDEAEQPLHFKQVNGQWKLQDLK
jgi:small-conductance mechanosensitive channel